MTTVLRRHYETMSAEDSISALVKSRESRTILLKLSSDLGVADDPKLRDALREDERRLAAYILSILESKSSKESVLKLDGDPAQSFLDVVQNALDRGLLLERNHNSKARRIIRKLSEASDKLPSSLFITGVTGRDEHATFGGGFGDIYQASYAGKTVALKHIRTFHGDAELRQIRLNFCREALVWQHLQHPYILPLIGIDRESFPASLCMVSPWMEHGTVLKYLNDHGRANVDRLVNILINDEWSACLADFGLTSLSDATTTTHTSNRAGSVRWMAPELLDPDRFGHQQFSRTPASDVYAFRCVCLELYTGRPPFADISETAAMLRVIDGNRPLKPSCDPAISEVLWQYMTEYWAENSATRPTTDIVVQKMGFICAGRQTQHSNLEPLPPLAVLSPSRPTSVPRPATPAQYQRESMHFAERAKIIQWLSPPHFFARHADIFAIRQEGTGVWFLEDPRFEKWLLSVGKHIWCSGIPGAGKTVLTWAFFSSGGFFCSNITCRSIVVDYLRSHLQSGNVGVGVAYMNHKETDTQSPSNILAGLWGQLVTERPVSPLVQQLYEKHREQRTNPSLAEVRGLFRSIVAEFSKVFVVVDALDEYPESHRHILLDTLAAMGGSISLMLTSRPNITPASILPTASVLEICANEEDIRRYVGAQIQNSFPLSRHVKARQELHEEIETKIVEETDGMFLLAKLHIDSLATKHSIKAVRDALRNLPKDLEHIYNEAMDRIESQNKDEREIAYRALTWVANAKRPLTISELQEAITIEPDAKALNADNLLDIHVILSVCAGLLTVDQGAIRLFHHTTQDYFDRIQPQLISDSTDGYHPAVSQDIRSLYHKYKLLAYASHYCLLHAAGEPEELLQDSIIRFLGDAHWWQNLRQQALDLGYEDRGESHYVNWPPTPSKLWIAALFGLQNIVAHLLKSDKSINEEEKADALIVASHWNCLGVVQPLLKHGTNVDAKEGAALRTAIEGGHMRVVQLLLEHGADVNAQGGHHGNALQAASIKGYLEVVRVLLQNHADVNALGGHYGTALQAASAEGNLDVVQLLLEDGANVDLQGGEYGTALQVATAKGNMAIVQLLLEHGADLNVQGGYYGFALQAASWTGSTEVVRLLLENGADHHGQGGIEVVQLLLKNGADVNVQGGYYGTALQAASWWGSVEIVQLLLENGADVDLQGGEYGTALQAAAAEGNLAVVQLLLEQGADVNLHGKHGFALWAASAGGSMEVVHLLIEKGADVNLQGDRYGSSPQEVSWTGSMEIVQLLENGANVDLQRGEYGTALQAAAAKGNVAVVQLLLEHGANVNVRGGAYHTAYRAAKEEDRIEVAELLIAHGADTSLDAEPGS
ncbi:ankyrin repeat-containing domain protein [Mycena rebaudengoi]|nr:ankyrin repeat-containing domain protein [Mycena rebaudengoi]